MNLGDAGGWVKVGERLLFKQEVAWPIPAGSMPDRSDMPRALWIVQRPYGCYVVHPTDIVTIRRWTSRIPIWQFAQPSIARF